MFKIIETGTGFGDLDWANCYDRLYIKEAGFLFKHWQGSFEIIDVTEALRPGKVCVSYSVRCWEDPCLVINFIDGNGYDKDLKALFNYLQFLTFERAGSGAYYKELQVKYSTGTLQIIKSEQQAVRVFSPFNLKDLKPLPEIPAKWTLTHAVRLIANEQYQDFHCNGHYTDDYAYDAAVNFDQGKKIDRLGFLQDIIEHPGGWHCWPSDGRLHINCHSFDCNSLVPVLKKA